MRDMPPLVGCGHVAILKSQLAAEQLATEQLATEQRATE